MTAEIEIRTCSPGDEDALALIGQATFLETFAGVLAGPDILSHCANAHSTAVYRNWLSDDRYRLWLAEINPGHAPVGFIVVAPAQLPLPEAERDLEIKRIYILSKFQGGGLGSRLVNEAIAHSRACNAKRLLLGVYAHNVSAIGFYERFGFKTLGNRSFNVGGQDYEDNIMGMSL